MCFGAYRCVVMCADVFWVVSLIVCDVYDLYLRVDVHERVLLHIDACSHVLAFVDVN